MLNKTFYAKEGFTFLSVLHIESIPEHIHLKFIKGTAVDLI